MQTSTGAKQAFEIKKADIGFLIHRDNWMSRTIAWFMRSRWSHAFLIKHVTDEDVYTLETSDFEVTIGMLQLYVDDPNVELEIWSPKNIDDEERKRIVIESEKTYGTVYGYLQLVSFGIRCILKRFNIHIKNFIRQGMVCDHVVLYGYRISSIAKLRGIDPESIDSEELYQLVKSSDDFELRYLKTYEANR